MTAGSLVKKAVQWCLLDKVEHPLVSQPTAVHSTSEILPNTGCDSVCTVLCGRGDILHGMLTALRSRPGLSSLFLHSMSLVSIGAHAMRSLMQGSRQGAGGIQSVFLSECGAAVEAEDCVAW